MPGAGNDWAENFQCKFFLSKLLFKHIFRFDQTGFFKIKFLESNYVQKIGNINQREKKVNKNYEYLKVQI